jgi:aminoglycoside 3-N-acetyltransferase
VTATSCISRRRTRQIPRYISLSTGPNLDIDTLTHASAVLVDGQREWVRWEDLDVDDGDFPDCGGAFEREYPHAIETGTVGVADAKLFSQPRLVDFAVEWFEATRD